MTLRIFDFSSTLARLASIVSRFHVHCSVFYHCFVCIVTQCRSDSPIPPFPLLQQTSTFAQMTLSSERKHDTQLSITVWFFHYNSLNISCMIVACWCFKVRLFLVLWPVHTRAVLTGRADGPWTWFAWIRHPWTPVNTDLVDKKLRHAILFSARPVHTGRVNIAPVNTAREGDVSTNQKVLLADVLWLKYISDSECPAS